MQHYDEWLQKLEQDRKATEDRVPAETFMLIRESDNRILGMVNIRLGLNKALLQHGGNIGYSVRPTERKKGYNTYQLYCALQFCKEQGLDKVLLTCKKDNVGSSKTIQHYGGILENEFFDSSDGSITLRYWIDVEEGLKIGAKQYKDKQKVLK